MKKLRNALILVASGLSACTLGNEARHVGTYDFGLPVQAAKQGTALPARVTVQETVAPAWLATTALHYRLAYHDAARLHSYADSRWAAPPASLLTLRLRQVADAAAAGGAPYQLRIELEEFSQVFDTPQDSHATVRARAVLSRPGERAPLSSQVFDLESKAPSADAVGGVRALTEAGDALVMAVTKWAAEEIRKRK